jgi:hypothetical protein
MFHGKIDLLESCLNLCTLHYLMFRRNRPLTTLWALWKWPWPLHITPLNLIFHSRIGVTRVINTLEMGFTCAHTPLLYGSVAESYILSRVHFLFPVQLRFLDCWKIMRKDKSPSNWSFSNWSWADTNSNGSSMAQVCWKTMQTSVVAWAMA